MRQDAEPPESDDERSGDVESHPPSAERVAKRALVLAAVGDRGLTENERDQAEDPEGHRLKILAWIDDVSLGDEVEPEEWKALQRPVGFMEHQSMVDAVWRLEGLGVLFWSLGQYALPDYDRLVDPSEFWRVTRVFDAKASREIVGRAALKSAHELEEYRKHATMVHWRLVNYRLRPHAIDFVEYSRDCWIGSFDIGRFHIIDRDMAVGGEPIAQADPGHVMICESAARERHLAINWLAGYSDVYSETDTST